MNGPGHYREAERSLSAASFIDRPGGKPVDSEASAYHMAAAQAHATLALAAATALGPAELPPDANAFDIYREWQAVAGAAPENHEEPA